MGIQKYFIVIDGKEEKQYEGIVEGTLVFSPDSQRLAYVARLVVGPRNVPESRELVNERFKECVVVNGKEEKKYDDIGEGTLIFSPDSKRVAYLAWLNNKWVAVVDGKEGKPYDDIIKKPIFSPGSRRLAYVAGVGFEKEFLVVDGEEEKAYDSIGTPVFSPDSQRLAYVTWTMGDKWFVVVDGKEEKQYHSIGWRTLIFSPDSQRLAYVVTMENKKEFVVLAGKETKYYDGIITTGGGRVIFDSPPSIQYLAIKDNEIYLVKEKIE